MYIKVDELKLLCDVYNKLTAHNEVELANQLELLITKLERDRKSLVEDSRTRAKENRENGYKWKSSYHPQKSKYYTKEENKQGQQIINKKAAKMKTYTAIFRVNPQFNNGKCETTQTIEACSIISARKRLLI